MTIGNLIKVVNPAKAKELALAGFSYMLEQNGDKELYVFTPTEELISYINTHFSKNDYMYGKRLKF